LSPFLPEKPLGLSQSCKIRARLLWQLTLLLFKVNILIVQGEGNMTGVAQGGLKMTFSSKKYKGVTDKEYFASGDWKCAKSATGGHWWDCNVEPFVCKSCGMVKATKKPASTLLS
jgi:hypothetical protein